LRVWRWAGRLIDATCNDQREQEKTVSRDASGATTPFAPDVAGKIYKLDAGGNAKATIALKYRAEPAPDPAGRRSKEVRAKVHRNGRRRDDFG
jgi:hypothetical protein